MDFRKHAHVWLWLLLVGMVTFRVGAGDEFVANTLTVSAQERPAIAQLKGGNVVVAWQSAGSGVRSVWMRLFSAAGVPLATNQLVFQAAGLDQCDPSVAALEGGGFVIAWSRKLPSPADYSIAYQVFTAAGVPLAGGPLQGNLAAPPGPHLKPQVAPLFGGGFVIAWVAQKSLADQNVFHRRFLPNGTPVEGAEVQSNGLGPSPITTGDQGGARVARLSDGGFVIVYEHRPASLVYGVRFDASGGAIPLTGPGAGTVQFLVGTNAATEFSEPSVAGLAGGGFVVAMTASTGSAASRHVVRRSFTAAGVGGPVVTQGSHAGRWEGPQAIGLPNGEFVLAWQAYGEPGDAGAWSVWVQRFAADGTPRLSPFMANQANAGNQRHAALAGRADSGYWSGWQSFGVDKDDYGISVRWYDPDDEIPGRLFISRFGSAAQQQYLVTFIGMGGRVHNLQATEALKGASTSWATVWTTNTPTGTFSYLESGSNRPPRFFRVFTP
ncbi:MAG TPA: hypothetical protein DCM86_01620 [Verrucomicrobiales bacterium]|nr:hypothetical protein [Verrucomicrobiales bacterium]